MVSMSKTPNAILNNAGRLAAQDSGVIGNVELGAQYGFVPHLATADGGTPLVLRPVNYVVTNAPGQFKYLPGYTKFTKLFFEQLAHTIDGVNIQITNEGHQALAMADGQQLTVPTDTKRQTITPNVTTIEYIGNPCYNFIYTWIMMNKDPDTQSASFAGILSSGTYIPPHTFSVFSADLTGIQYDTTLRKQNIVDGFQLTAVHPQDSGDAEFKHEIGVSTVPERQFPFHAVWMKNANTYVVAQELAETLQLHRVNANFATPCARDIESIIQNYGIQKEAASAITDFVPMGSDASVLSA